MYNPTTSDTQERAREIIESTIADVRDTCACGRPMTISTSGNQIRIECESLRGKHGLRLALASAFHDWRSIELPEELPAAA